MAMVLDPKTADAAISIPPNPSIYVQNLQMKRFQKTDLKRELYMLFATYGTVLDVTAVKSEKMRGQAHVLFKDVQTATQAIRACQGQDFFGRTLKLSYSRNRANTLAKLTGTANVPTPVASSNKVENGFSSSIPAPPGKSQSIIPAPPGTLGAAGLPSKPVELKPPVPVANAPSPQGTKRQRDESDDEGDAPMEEDDDDEAMDMSESDDE